MTRRSISKEALSRLQSVAVKSFSVPIIDTKPTIVEVANKPEFKEDDKLSKIINHRQMAERMYLNLVQKFIDEQCEFDQNAIVSFTDLKSYWDQWIRDNDHDIKKYNVSWRVKLKDISRLDNRFEVKRIANCKFCKKRHFARCCDQYVYKGCTTEHAMQNIKLKLKSNSSQNNIDDGSNLL